MAAAAGATTARTQETSEKFNMKACLNDLTKIPQKEFEAQFRNWMEKDGVARAMQAKLRADLIANFNKTNLGKHIIGQTPTNRLTLSPMEMALNTLVAEFLFAQNCHFSLSVYSTEAPFRNTLPDFDSLTHFRFKENEVTEIVKAICGPLSYDWNIKNKILKNYAATKSTALLHFILKGLLENNAEKAQHKISVGTNTRPFKMLFPNQPLVSSDIPSVQQTRRDTKAEFYNTNFRYLNRYLIILSRKVKDMSEQFQRLQYIGGAGQPRVRVLKSMGRRKYEDLNRSLERVTENLKQMANAKRKSKRVTTIVKAIEALAAQFQRCAENFENVSKDLKTTRSKVDKSTTSSELLINQNVKNPSIVTTIAAASQTDVYIEKPFADWLHEMRYTRNGQRFLDRIEKSFMKALERQKRELSAESEVKLRHQKELMRIRYKQKALQEICSHGNQSAHRIESHTSNLQSNETISEQFRQFELKHFDLLSKIYESENERKVSDGRNFKELPQRTASIDKAVHFNAKENKPLPKSSSEFESCDLKLTSSSDNIEQTPQQSKQVLKEKNAYDMREQVKTAIGEIVTDERNVDQIVMDAKLRIRELEFESNQLTENFLGYLNRQREQKLAAREAAQSLWNDYMNEREKMQKRYKVNSSESKQVSDDMEILDLSQSKQLSDLQSKHIELQSTLELYLSEHRNRDGVSLFKNDIKDVEVFVQPKAVNSVHNSKESGSESSSSYMELKNPIIQAKEMFFESERQFKAKNSKQLLEDSEASRMDFDNFLKLNELKTGDTLKTMTVRIPDEPEMLYMPQPLSKPQTNINSWMATFLSESLSGTNTDLSTDAGKLGTAEMAALSNVQLAANWQQGSFERPQNGSVNKSRRREIIATAKEAVRNQRTATITTNAILAAAATATAATLPATIPRALNKNNADGASVAEAQQEHSNNYKIKIDAGYGQKHTLMAMEHQQQQLLLQKQSKVGNNDNNTGRTSSGSSSGEDCFNKTSNIKSNCLTEVRAIATETSMVSTKQASTKPSLSKPKVSGNSGTELSRRTVLKQTMARMQQLFSPHQQQQRPQHQKQQIMLAYVSEEDENDAESSGEVQQRGVGKIVEKSWQIEKNPLESKTNNNNSNNENKDTTNTHNQHAVVDADCENVVGHYKNNFLLKQKIAKRTAKYQQEQQQQQQQQIAEFPTTSMRNIHELQRVAIATNRRSNTTLHSIDDGNKTVEALVDWQQIACGPSSRQNEAKVNVDKVKVATTAKVTNAAAKGNYDNDHTDEYDDDDFEKDLKENEMNLSPLGDEPGEVFERSKTPPETMKEAEIGELIEHSDSDDVPLRTSVASVSSFSASEVSSIDLQSSNSGGDGRGIRSISFLNMATFNTTSFRNGSDSDGDFWK